jgi:hypothetical protein
MNFQKNLEKDSEKIIFATLSCWFLIFLTHTIISIIISSKTIEHDFWSFVHIVLDPGYFLLYIVVGAPLFIFLMIAFYLSIKKRYNNIFLKKLLLLILPVSFSILYYFLFFQNSIRWGTERNLVPLHFLVVFLVYPIITSLIFIFKKDHLFYKYFFIFFITFLIAVAFNILLSLFL